MRSSGEHEKAFKMIVVEGCAEKKVLSFYEKRGMGAAKGVESVGSGYLPLHQVDTRKMSTDKAYALHKGMMDMGRGI